MCMHPNLLLEPEVLRHKVLNLAVDTWLWQVIKYKGEHLPAQNGRVVVALLDEGEHAFLLDTLEQRYTVLRCRATGQRLRISKVVALSSTCRTISSRASLQA